MMAVGTILGTLHAARRWSAGSRTISARAALGVGAASGFAATLVAVVFLIQMTRQSLPEGGASEA